MHMNEGNRNAHKHGAASAEKALTSGDNLSGLALEAAEAVQGELQDVGAVGMLRRDAIRFEAVASLLYARILACTNPAELDTVVKRWGWIQAHAVRSWQGVVQQERDKDRGMTAADVLDAIKRVQDENND